VALNLACDTVGEGPPLLVLHGLFGSGGNWRGVARALAASFTVYCIDLRNHGSSPWSDSMAYADMADDVLQLMDKLGLETSAVMGHSMGGKTAMALALRHPQRVSRLIVVDIAPIAYADTLTPFAEAMRSADVMAAASRAEVQSRLRQTVPDQGVVPFLMQNLVAQNEHFDWRLNLIGISASMPGLCSFPSDLLSRRFGGPSTVIAGENSHYVADRDGAAFRPMFERLRVEFIAGAGHWVHADQPAAFIACVQRALQAEPTAASL
jgi:esterase